MSPTNKSSPNNNENALSLSTLNGDFIDKVASLPVVFFLYSSVSNDGFFTRPVFPNAVLWKKILSSTTSDFTFGFLTFPEIGFVISSSLSSLPVFKASAIFDILDKTSPGVDSLGIDHIFNRSKNSFIISFTFINVPLSRLVRSICPSATRAMNSIIASFLAMS